MVQRFKFLAILSIWELHRFAGSHISPQSHFDVARTEMPDYDAAFFQRGGGQVDRLV